MARWLRDYFQCLLMNDGIEHEKENFISDNRNAYRCLYRNLLFCVDPRLQVNSVTVRASHGFAQKFDSGVAELGNKMLYR